MIRAVALAAAAVLGLGACTSGTSSGVTVPGGDADRGARLITHYGCGACHTIPGIPRADARVGPSLAGLADRRLIAGRLDNSPENVARWIQSPQELEPGTAMPDLGVEAKDARDIAAYLYRH